MTMLVDTHAHLDFDTYDGCLCEVIARAEAAGVGAIVTVGTSPAGSAACVQIARRHPTVRAAVGIHPHDARDARPEDLDAIEALARDPLVVAVGETGLDYVKEYSPRRDQRTLFERHIEIARRVGKPLVVHNRGADADCRAVLDACGDVTIVLHCFSADRAMAAWAADRNCFISVAGPVTYRNAEALREAVATVRPDRLLVETDCPYLTPQPKRGRVPFNEPAHVVHTAAAVAELVGLSFDAFAQVSTANARRVFGLDAPDEGSAAS